MFIGTVQKVGQVGLVGWMQKVIVNNKEVYFKMDTGADVNVLSLKTAKELEAKVQSSNTKLLNYEGSVMGVYGELPLFVKPIIKNTMLCS